MADVRVRAIAALLALSLVACGGDSTDTPPHAPDNVTGEIVDVQPAEGTPEEFVVEEADGDVFTIEVDPEMDYGFDLQHLHEHHETADPVDVTIRSEGERLVATEIVDV